MPIPQESVNVQNGTNGKLPDEGLDAIKRDIAALCRLANSAPLVHGVTHLPDGADPTAITFLRSTLATRPTAAAANRGFAHETTDTNARGVTRSDGSVWNELPLAFRDRMAINIRDYLDPLGWVNDGSAQPLSGFFASLGAAQAVFPNAAALTDEIAGVAIQYCINLTQPASTFRGGRIEIPEGTYRVNVSISLTAVTSVDIEGHSAVWNSYTNIYGGWPNKNMPGTSRLLWTGTGALISFTDQLPAAGIPTKGIHFKNLVFNVDNQTEDIFSADGGTGIFFSYCYFGGGNRQLYYSASTPFDYYYTGCFFGPSLNDTLPLYGLYVGATVIGYGGQSTVFQACTFRFMQRTHIRSEGMTQIKLNSCTLESTQVGPSIWMDTPAVGTALYCYNCHWEQIFKDAYWNGTYFQYTNVDTERASCIRFGTSGTTHPAYLSLFQSDINLRVAASTDGTDQIYAILMDGAGRLAVQDCGLTSQLKRALVYSRDATRIGYVSRLAGTYNPTNGDLLVTGPDDTRKRMTSLDISGMPPSAAYWSAIPTNYSVAKTATFNPLHLSATRALIQWRAATGYGAPTFPLTVRRDLFILSPADLSDANLQTDQAPFARSDILWYENWRGNAGSGRDGGYGTRIGMYCGKAAAASNTADCWFPLITGPGLSGDVGNNNLTWNHREFTEQWYNTPLTAEKTLTIANWSVEPNGARLRVVRTSAATGAYDLIVYSNKDAAELIRLRAGQWVDLMFTGASWKVMGSGPVELSTTAEFEWRRPMKVVTATAAAAPAANEVTVGGGTLKMARTTDATAREAVAGDDTRLTNARKPAYVTGDGGAVTQGTSRTTGVTLNKLCGAITLVSAAGQTAWQTFTVTNSTVAATDVVTICQKSGTDLHLVQVTAVADGSFNVTFATTGGTTTEQPVFNFAVVKAVAS